MSHVTVLPAVLAVPTTLMVGLPVLLARVVPIGAASLMLTF